MAKTAEKLAPWEIDLLDLFVSMFDTLGIPKSVAQIYGVLYLSDDPLMQEDIAAKLQISIGSASQGVRFLVNIGAAHKQSVPGLRQAVFTAERSMRRLLSYFIDVQLRPKLNSGRERLQAIQSEIPEGDPSAQKKIDTLLQWQKKAEKALPIISTIFGK